MDNYHTRILKLGRNGGERNEKKCRESFIKTNSKWTLKWMRPSISAVIHSHPKKVFWGVFKTNRLSFQKSKTIKPKRQIIRLPKRTASDYLENTLSLNLLMSFMSRWSSKKTMKHLQITKILYPLKMEKTKTQRWMKKTRKIISNWWAMKTSGRSSYKET